MARLLENVIPLLLLIAFGYFLRRKNYFEETAIKGLTGFVANLLIPCVLFNTFMNLDFRTEHLWIAVSFFILMLILMGCGFALYRILPGQRRFFPFFHCAFAFGFMGIPLFSTVFGEDKMEYLVAMGVGHELFIGLIFMTASQLYLKNKKVEKKALGKSLLSPLFIMITLALLIRALGLKEIIEANFLGKGILDAISRLGGVTTVLIMIIVGYRIRFDNRTRLMESIRLVGIRYLLTFSVGYLYKFLVMDRLSGGSIYFDYAFFTLLSQHGSVVLTAYIGEYGSTEDLEVASNALVINELAGIALYLIFVFMISKGGAV
ncbi:AEC family transporter [Cuneatibacter sp. NSJ-177]|uniref:AEC family transporter n=1 Tax=Cuneatibacter sp. NSJ-177 TaxID=2931401 RepID=UPI001FCFC306|nr:AEC family transporter [Cuneatibacter sp. NSJ-177]MCJ7835482.1 AEC family transporter [Cuneatibacter sp. NSJ-177]